MGWPNISANDPNAAHLNGVYNSALSAIKPPAAGNLGKIEFPANAVNSQAAKDWAANINNTLSTNTSQKQNKLLDQFMNMGKKIGGFFGF